MTNVFFERDIYMDLVKWATEDSNYALRLRGPRQVGKTSILKKLGSEHFKTVVYVNPPTTLKGRGFELVEAGSPD